MALTSKQYKSLSRPSGGSSGGISSYSTTLVRRQNAAEDAIIDDRYEQGLLSAEAYRQHLETRSTRMYLTPAQIVALNEKIRDTQIKVYDAEIDRKYAAGELSTDQVLKYEQSKLKQMTEPNSVAYQNQLQKIEQLTARQQKEQRTQFRVQSNLAISQMPEDSSDRLLAKASEYEKLEAMARADGDNQQADVYATNKNNYIQSAKRADINDLITGVRLKTSQTPTAGLGVPSADAGQTLYNSLFGNTGSSSSSTGQPVTSVPGQAGSSGVAGGSVNTGFKGGSSSPALRNAFESIDRSQKMMDRLSQERADKQAVLQTYEQAIQRATGDQQTQLIIARNNIVDEIKRIDNTLDVTISGIEEKVARVQEIQAAAAASAFSQEVRKNNQMFSKAETDLETAFATGKINKQEYIQKGIALAETKATFSTQASDIFSQYGNDVSAESYLQKAEEISRIHENLLEVGGNLDDYETVQVDPGGKVTNLFGKGLKPGDFSLQNVRQLKDSGAFDLNYIQKDGKFYKIYFPQEISDSTGFLVSKNFSEDLAKMNNEFFIYRAGQDGRIVKEPVNFVKYDTKNAQGNTIVKPYFKSDVDNLTKKGVLVNDPKLGLITSKTQKTPLLETLKTKGAELIKGAQDFTGISPQSIQAAGGFPRTGKMEKVNGVDTFFPFKDANLGFLQQPVNQIKGAISGASKNVGNFVSSAIDSIKGFFGGGGNQQAKKNDGNFVKSAVSGLLGKVVPRVEAAEPSGKKFDQEIAQAFGPEAANAARVLMGENSRRDPRATNVNRDGSIDRGLFQVNSNTFADFQRRHGAELAAAGIRSFDDMYDPLKNAQMAKIIHNEQGWQAWYGAPEDLRKPAANTPTPSPTAVPTRMPTATPQPQPQRLQLVPQAQAANVAQPKQQSAPREVMAGRTTPAPAQPNQYVYSGLPANPVQQAIKNISNTVQNVVKAVSPPKITSPVPAAPKPNIIQQAAKSVQNVVSQAVNTAKNLVSKLKFW